MITICKQYIIIFSIMLVFSNWWFQSFLKFSPQTMGRNFQLFYSYVFRWSWLLQPPPASQFFFHGKKPIPRCSSCMVYIYLHLPPINYPQFCRDINRPYIECLGLGLKWRKNDSRPWLGGWRFTTFGWMDTSHGALDVPGRMDGWTHGIGRGFWRNLKWKYRGIFVENM